MYSGILAFFAGVLAVQCLPDLLPSLLALPVLLFALWRRWPLGCLFACGVLWTAARAAMLLQAGLDPALEGETVIVRGTVTSVPAPLDRALRFEFDPDELMLGTRTGRAPRRVSLSWYQQAPEVKLGERWQLTVRLKRVWGTRNPGGFDFERWAFERGIRATGYIVASNYNERLSAPSRWTLGYWRERALDLWRRHYGGHERSGVLTALILGEQQSISDAEWTTLRRTGTTHLMSVSGLHVSLTAAIGYWLVRWGCCLWPPLLRRVPAQTFGWCGAFLCGFGYALLTGFSLPAQRSAIMLAVALAQRLRGQPVAAAETFLMALFLVLLIHPLAVLSSGFWLSFGAVAIIFLVLGARVGRVSWPVRLCRLHLAITLGLAPLAALLFQQNPLLGPIANLIAIPLVSWIIFPLVLAALPLAALVPRWGEWLFRWAHVAMDYLWLGLERIAAIDAGLWDLPSPGIAATLCAVVGVGLLLLPRGIPLRALGFVWLAPLLFDPTPRIEPGTARIDVLDAGQALAVIVRTARHTLVFDTGLSDSVIVPVLRQQRVRRVDRVIVSHADSDHGGGLPGLIEALPVEELFASESRIAGIPAVRCRRGMRWHWDGVDFRILHPATQPRGGRNDASCVLRVAAGSTVALLPGDIERTAERELLAIDATALRADLLVAPHHGSASSSTAVFIEAVDPSQVVFAVGYRNRFGLPSPAVIARYQERGVTLHRTDASGMLRFELGTNLVGPRRFRIEHPRYWHSR